DLDKSASEAVAVKKLQTAVSTGGDKLELAGLKMATIEGHGTRISAERQKVTESQSYALRQPAYCF
ncbi:MAG: hypothetical protein ACLQOO_23080, partial [Terriglobia bacterium]